MNARANASLLALACVAVCGVGAAAAAQPGSSPSHPLNAEQALHVDARVVARTLGISPEAALSRLIVQQHAGPIAERIRAQHAGRLAGIYIEHEPASRLVVRLTGYEAIRPEFHVLDSGDRLEVAYELGARHSFADLHKRFQAGFAKLGERVPGVRSGYVDERTGEIVIEVLRDEVAKAGGLARLQQAAGGSFGVATRLVERSAPLENQALRGNGKLDFQQTVGFTTQNRQCTSAFTVVHPSTGVYGALTAAHCPANLASGQQYTYTEASGTTTHTITHVDRRFDAARDVGWMSISTNPADAENVFRDSSGWRTQTNIRTKAATIVGQTMCGWGEVGSYVGQRCGDVISKDYNPGSLCGPGITFGSGTSTCDPVYIKVEAPLGTCVPGHSGGGWYDVAFAAGIHKAGAQDIANNVDECVYSTIEDILGAPLNLQLRL